MSRIERRHVVSKWLRSPSKLALIGLNLVVYYLIVRWVAENIQPSRLFDHLGQIPVWALLGSIFINLIALVLYGVRMALLLSSDFRTAFSIVNIGYALNTLMPLRLGDAMKLYLGNKLYKTPLVGIFAASVVEKMVDLFYLLLLGVIVTVFTTGELIHTSVLFPVAVLVFLVTAATILFRLYIVRIVKLLPKRGRLRRISIELHKYASSYPVGRLLITSFAIWTLNVAMAFFAFNTYLPELRIGLLEAATLLLIVVLVIAIPSAPAGIGLFEAGIVAYLTTQSGVSNEAALAAAASFHLINTLPQLAIASLLLLSRMRRAKGTAQ